MYPPCRHIIKTMLRRTIFVFRGHFCLEFVDPLHFLQFTVNFIIESSQSDQIPE